MQIVVAGAHGQIARLLHPLLVARGHGVRGLVRNPDHEPALRALGAEPVLCDLEQETDLSACVGRADAVVFAAGAGPGSGAERKRMLDCDGALKLIDAARANGIGRYVMVSAMNPERPRGDEVFRAYLRAKAEADAALRASGLDWTIVRPGRLTDDPGSGRVAIARELERADTARRRRRGAGRGARAAGDGRPAVRCDRRRHARARGAGGGASGRMIPLVAKRFSGSSSFQGIRG